MDKQGETATDFQSIHRFIHLRQLWLPQRTTLHRCCKHDIRLYLPALPCHTFSTSVVFPSGLFLVSCIPTIAVIKFLLEAFISQMLKNNKKPTGGNYAKTYHGSLFSPAQHRSRLGRRREGARGIGRWLYNPRCMWAKRRLRGRPLLVGVRSLSTRNRKNGKVRLPS